MGGAEVALHRLQYDSAVRYALLEDLGRAGDVTSNSLIGEHDRAEFRIVAREAGTIAGLGPALLAFELIDPAVDAEALVDDGSRVEVGSAILATSGPARSILTAERTALNFLGHLSGIATATARFVDAVSGTGASIVCTRKTSPGLRVLQKHAVRSGGGSNHRFGLDDAVLIKDNHIAVVGSVAEAVQRARANAGHMVKVEVEVDTLDQLAEAIDARADVVLLDNMDPDTLRAAVAMVDGAMLTEASGGITLDTVRAVAEAGVDLISVGWLTHSAPNLDLGLDG